jgi:hypothetical protein
MPSEATSIFGLAAEFLTPEEIVRAAQQVRSAGYSRAEAYTPFPIKGLPETLGFGRTWIPLICLIGGVLGAAAGFFMCWYANVISYTWIVGNRPLNSWPAFITITIDVMIGGAFFSALIAMLLLNGLPRLTHPLFNIDAFSRATQDRYFLCIEATDAQFDLEVTRSFLVTLQPAAIHAVPK